MTLNYNGKLARFHRWTYDDSPSDNLCPFFWRMIIACALFPFIWLSHPFNCRSVWQRIGWSAIVLIVLSLVGGLTGATLVGYYSPLIALGILTAIVLGILTIVLLTVGTCEGIRWLATDGREKLASTETVSEVLSVVRERKNAFKDKFCPRIEWKF